MTFFLDLYELIDLDRLWQAAKVGAGLTLLSATIVLVGRRSGWIRPLLDAERRWRLPLRVLGAIVWVTLLSYGMVGVVAFLQPSMAWVATALGWAAWVSLTALGIGVALL